MKASCGQSCARSPTAHTSLRRHSVGQTQRGVRSVACFQTARSASVVDCGPDLTLDLTCGPGIAPDPCVLTLKHQRQDTHNDLDQRIRRRGTVVRVECQSNDGIWPSAVSTGPEVEARGRDPDKRRCARLSQSQGTIAPPPVRPP